LDAWSSAVVAMVAARLLAHESLKAERENSPWEANLSENRIFKLSSAVLSLLCHDIFGRMYCVGIDG
jgi:hypothetical protein